MKKRIVMEPQLRIIPIWRSSDGVQLGFAPAIFGSDQFSRPIQWRTFLVCALDHIDLMTEDGSGIYKSLDEAEQAWEQARIIPLSPPIRGKYAIPDDTGDAIDLAGLYRTIRDYDETPQQALAAREDENQL